MSIVCDSWDSLMALLRMEKSALSMIERGEVESLVEVVSRT